MACRISFYYEDKEKGLNPIFKGEYLQYDFKIEDEDILVSVGLGKYDKLEEAKVKEIFARTVKEIKKKEIKEADFEIQEFINRFGEEVLIKLAQGVELGQYKFDKYKEKKDEYTLVYNLFNNGEKVESELVEEGKVLAEGIMIARDLVNYPPNYLTPERFSKIAKEKGKEVGIEVEILDKKDCRKLGMETFLAVGESSDNEPKLIVLRYLKGEKDEEVKGLVGKGITYDTGGYSLKTSMVNMKTDMAGAAAVLGTVYALAKNNIKTNVIGVMPCCENRLSNTARVPDDIVNSMNGKTIEINNIDAEGRLILADAVTYIIREEKVANIIDIATLTGAVVRALGKHVSGAITNNNEFYNRFEKAIEISDEKYHLFPTDDIYRKDLESNVADIKNSGTGAGTIVGGCFIESFVEDTPWIHLDIAGTADTGASPVFEYQAKGGTGVGVASMYQVCKDN